jgi:hypothetical protein
MLGLFRDFASQTGKNWKLVPSVVLFELLNDESPDIVQRTEWKKERCKATVEFRDERVVVERVCLLFSYCLLWVVLSLRQQL